MEVCYLVDFDEGETRVPRKSPQARLGLVETDSPPTMILASFNLSSLKAAMMAIKMSLENKQLGNGDYFVVISSSLPPLLLTEHSAN